MVYKILVFSAKRFLSGAAPGSSLLVIEYAAVREWRPDPGEPWGAPPAAIVGSTGHLTVWVLDGLEMID